MEETTSTTPSETQDGSVAVIDAPSAPSVPESEKAAEPAKEVKLTRREIEAEAARAVNEGQADPAAFRARLDKKLEEKAAKAKPAQGAEAAAGDKSNNPEGDREARRNAALAEQALKRDGWSDQEIADLPEAMRLKVGLKAKAKQDERQREFEKHRRGANQSGRNAAAAEGREPDPDPAGVRSEPDPNDSALEPAEGLDDVLELLDESDQSRIKKALANAVERTREAELRATAVTIEAVRHGLQAEYPDLAGGKAMQAVLDEMDAIDPRGEALAAGRSAVEQLMRKAASVAFGPSKQRARHDRNERTRETLDGQPDVGSVAARPSGKITQAERERIGIDVVREFPGDPERQRAEMNRRLGL